MMGRGIVVQCVRLFCLGEVVLFAATARADLVISFADSPVVITFDETLAGVNQNQFRGEGFAPEPTFGQLDSDSWEIDAESATMPFGGSAGPPPTLFAGGDPQNAVAFEGVFSANTSGTNRALGIQPHNDHFTPGTITLRILNDTGANISAWNVAYDLFAFNDTGRSTSMDFSYAVGMTTPGTFAPVPLLDFDSATIADGIWSSAVPKSAELPANVAAGGHLFLRWTVNTSNQEGIAIFHDEIALDNISVTAVAVPEPGAFLICGGVAALAGLSVGICWLNGRKSADNLGCPLRD
jgi:hypothetical protein